jgi:transcriptional antiterminator NusG
MSSWQIPTSPLVFPTLGADPQEPNWYAIHTRSRHEKMVFNQLRAKGINTFLPLVSSVHRWSDRDQTVESPLFPGYAFINMVPTTETYYSVLQTPGVAKFIGDGRKGIPIPDKEIEDIRTILEQKHPFAEANFLKIGQRVRVCGGCLDGVEGILVAQNSNKSLLVSVDLIQKAITISVDGYDVVAV